MKNVFDKYIFPVLTAFNTYMAISLIIALFSPTATPLTAFLAIVISFVALAGIAVLAIQYKFKS